MTSPVRRITPKKAILVLFDISAAVAAILFACLIYYSGSIPASTLDSLRNTWYIYLITSGFVFYLSGFYDQMWAYSSGTAYLSLFIGVSFHMLVMVMVSQLLGERLGFPIYILYWFLLLTAVSGVRLLYRLTRSNSPFLARIRGRDPVTGQIRVMIVGAGVAGSQVILEMKTRQQVRVPILAIDDNPLTHTYQNNGVPVLGNRFAIPALARQYEIDEIIIAIPSARPERIREIVEICHQTPCRVRILPFFGDLIEGRFTLADIRDVAIEDLLGRDPQDLEIDKISSYLTGKTVLITGGGGSIGGELCRQIAPFGPSRLIIFEIYENNAYTLQQELTARYGTSLNLTVLIGSIRDQARLNDVFETYRPDVVFHAAAHKHVPLMEESRVDAVKNNVYGTRNVAEPSGRYGASRFVLISTDKAVNPTNVMGSTKRIAEMVIMQMRERFPDTRYAAVRFGNVLGSSGSVIPLFKQQIEREKRVTVTHPDIERFFMTIPEAACLVLQAGAYANGGEIFVLDMGKPVKISDLARDLIRLSGYEPDVDIPIEYVGLRPGEKMFEELYLDSEAMHKTEHDKIFVLEPVASKQALRTEAKRLEGIINASESGIGSFLDQLLK